ncbi:hypothetical protein LIA77_09320 [Sarocladium implicatum]|nr:hypothetical protein LIA77_09320 [Sarocladium implicatum]
MPTVIRPTDNAPREWRTRQAAVQSARELLPGDHQRNITNKERIIKSSFDDVAERHVSPNANGFVNAAFYAYNEHHHLEIRPEDVWFAILTQLGFYVNANAEDLRSVFVAFEGKKEIVVQVEAASIDDVDVGLMAVLMTKGMQKVIVDEGLRAWILPDFTTTQPADTATAAVLMMGVLQKYFAYTIQVLCGLPSVTLLGEREDWVKIRKRLDRLKGWGEEAVTFSERLKVVLDHFVLSFDEPTSERAKEFWNKIVHYESMGSGPDYLSGWLTAFCFWNSEGKPIRDLSRGDPQACNLDGISFSRIETGDIPNGYISCQVKVEDNGKEVKTRMVAGSVGIAVKSSGEPLEERPSLTLFSSKDKKAPEKKIESPGLDTLQPVSGWWMYELPDDSTAWDQDAQEGSHLEMQGVVVQEWELPRE